ncbi:unnamed protein product [Lupinus luteus]|uniref:LysM domain-containing protein n=1 Tax=Lupinus luteus TaxID=3873 RepID=A0AAV1WSR3_LUPLU
MRNYLHFHSPLLLYFLFFSVLCLVQTKSIIEPCTSSFSCPSLLSYLLPWDSKLSEISTRFNVNVSDILAANYVYPITTPTSYANQILRAKTIVKIPIPCPCVDGIRRSMSTIYTVQPSDTLSSISDGFGGLVSGEQIKSVNSINPTNPLVNGGKIVIPLPCSCLNNVNNGGNVVYMSYVVQKGESLGSIAMAYGTTVSDMKTVNGLAQPAVDPGDILSVPISACSSAPLNWYNESLIVPNGSYALTATNCIKCTCAPLDLKMQCNPSGMDVPCYNLHCKGSNLLIGDVHVEHSKTGCNVSQCVYRGHRGGKILSSMVNSTYLLCPDNQSYSGATCWPSYPLVLSPSQTPMPDFDAPMRSCTSSRRLGQFSFIILLQLFIPKLSLYLFM